MRHMARCRNDEIVQSVLCVFSIILGDVNDNKLYKPGAQKPRRRRGGTNSAIRRRRRSRSKAIADRPPEERDAFSKWTGEDARPATPNGYLRQFSRENMARRRNHELFSRCLRPMPMTNKLYKTMPAEPEKAKAVAY